MLHVYKEGNYPRIVQRLPPI